MSIQEQVSGSELRRRLNETGVVHSDVARRLKMPRETLSRILNGWLPMPEDLPERVGTILLEITAERHAVARALVGGGEREGRQ